MPRSAVAVDGDRFPLGRNRRQPASVHELEIEQLVRPERLGQIDDDVVLSADAQRHQIAVARARDGAHGQRLRQRQHQGGNRIAARCDEQCRFSVDPFPSWIEARVDVVVDDVEVGLVVLVEEGSARGQFLLRGINRDGPVARTVEETDVFGLIRRPHVGEMRPVGVHLGDEVTEFRNHRPSVAAEVRELDAEGSRQVLLEHGFGATEIARVHVANVEGGDVEPAIEFGRVRAQVHPVEAARVHVAAAVDADLALFGGRRRRKRHFPAAKNDDACHAGVGFGHKGDAVRNAQLEVLGAQREVHNPVFLFGVHRQPVQASHGREHVQACNAPIRCLGRRAEHPHEERTDPRISPVLGQHVDVDVVGEPLGDLWYFGAQPLLDYGASDARLQPLVAELLTCVCARGDQGGVGACVRGGDDALEVAHQAGHAVVGWRKGLGVRIRRQNKRERQQDRPHRCIRPRTGPT